VAAFILAACGGSDTQEHPQATPRIQAEATEAGESVEVEGESVEVTRIVTEEIVVTVESAMEEQAESLPTIRPLPTASPAFGTPIAHPTLLPDNFFDTYGVNPFISTAIDHLSTFALDVDTGAYTIARRYVRDGLLPPPDAVRVEEFVNYFDQEYALPPDVAFAVYADGSPSPFHHDGTYLLRIGVQGYDVPAAERPAASLTFVIDVSGSMAQENRLGLVNNLWNCWSNGCGLMTRLRLLSMALRLGWCLSQPMGPIRGGFSTPSAACSRKVRPTWKRG
jgi:hypothetical protein